MTWTLNIRLTVETQVFLDNRESVVVWTFEIEFSMSEDEDEDEEEREEGEEREVGFSGHWRGLARRRVVVLSGGS